MADGGVSEGRTDDCDPARRVVCVCVCVCDIYISVILPPSPFRRVSARIIQSA